MLYSIILFLEAQRVFTIWCLSRIGVVGKKKWKNVQTSSHGNHGITGVFNKTFIGTFSGVVALAEMVPLWIWNSAADEIQ